MNAPPSSAKPVVRLAWIAYELAAVMKTKTPAEHAALPATTFGADHSACVGRAERRVALKLASAAPVEGVVLEGCPPPPNAYAVVVIEGAHPSAVLVESGSGRVVRLASGVELSVPEQEAT